MLIVEFLDVAGATADWWSPTALGAYATFLVVLVSLGLGVLSIRREEERAEKERRARWRAHDTEVSAHAYALRRQLREWLREPWPEDPASRITKAEDLTWEKGLDPAEERSRKIVTASSGASPEMAEAARRQYVLFYRATLLLNRASVARAVGEDRKYDPISGTYDESLEWPPILTEGMDRARTLLEECVETLTEALDEDIREAEARLEPEGG